MRATRHQCLKSATADGEFATGASPVGGWVAWRKTGAKQDPIHTTLECLKAS